MSEREIPLASTKTRSARQTSGDLLCGIVSGSRTIRCTSATAPA